MSEERQQNQMELVFPVGERGEASKAAKGRAEARVAEHEAESPATTEKLMEEVCERENLRKALQRVKSNRGGAGVDGMEVWKLTGYLKEHWPGIREQLLHGEYQPQPVRRVEIPKPDGGQRNLGIPTVLDRFVQQAVMQVLQRLWEPKFSEHSYGFRPGRSAHQAVAEAQRYMREGFGYVVDIDLEKFFDRVNHDKLMGQVAKVVQDQRVLKVIRAFLNAGVMAGGLVSPTMEGTPQGGPLSPLLSNIVLDEMDRELEARGHRFVRYADDCNIYVRSERAGERVMESVRRFITKRLKLKVNEEKSAVGRPEERKFLGFSFLPGEQAKRRIAPKAVKRFKERIRELTRRSRMGMPERIKKMAEYMRGWAGYYGFCETPSALRDLTSWVRRRLRCLIWKQWSLGRRYWELKKRGVETRQAWNIASGAHGPWRASRSMAMQKSLSNAYFSELGLPTMVTWVPA